MFIIKDVEDDDPASCRDPESAWEVSALVDSTATGPTRDRELARIKKRSPVGANGAPPDTATLCLCIHLI